MQSPEDVVNTADAEFLMPQNGKDRKDDAEPAGRQPGQVGAPVLPAAAPGSVAVHIVLLLDAQPGGIVKRVAHLAGPLEPELVSGGGLGIGHGVDYVTPWATRQG